MPNKIEAKAIATAKHYLEVCGHTVEDVPESTERRGYDILARRDAEELKMAVKGSNRLWSIPDLETIEFDPAGKLAADFVYVVYFIGRREPTLPREAIKPEFVMSKQGFRISRRFKTESTLKPFLHAI